jgi:DNA segregation ATPase FtsK/SpoIIIE-like protein
MTPPKIILVFIAILIATGSYFQPAWATRPVISTIDTVLHYMGVGVVLIVLWSIAFLLSWRYRPGLLFRKWRAVLGTATLVIATLGILAYFEGPISSSSQAINLGGIYGLKIQGDILVLSFLRMISITLLGFWILAPQRTSKILRFAVTGLIRVGSLVPQGIRTTIKTARWIRKHLVLIIHVRKGTTQNINPIQKPNNNNPRPSRPVDNVPQHDRTSSADSKIEFGPSRNAATSLDTTQRGANNQRRKLTRARWQLPSMSLLDSNVSTTAIGKEHQDKAILIEETLGDHGVEVRVAEIRPGPTVTMFGLVPGWNRSRKNGSHVSDATDEKNARNRVKVDSILAREKDLALALAAPSLRIEAPVPGESVVGIEVPNATSSTVGIRPVMESENYQKILGNGGLPIALGQASAGESASVDLLAMPHLLIAGATGSGKSVCMNAVISSLITHQQPDSVRLLLIDPKRVELTPYNGIPHLVTPVVVDTDRVIRLLRGAIQEMLRRYRLLEEAGVRHVQSYNLNPKATEHIPYLIICIDELADLMMTSSFDVEQSICRLAQLGRATGIHLVVATQRPSVDVVTGLIKANFPSRISFAVASQVDSRTILDAAGAERLLGKGDMLFLSSDAAKPRRIQGVFISEEESAALADHWRSHDLMTIPEIPLEDLAREAMAVSYTNTDNQGRGDGDDDAIYKKALDIAVTSRALSTSLLQRRLRIGYPRAARLMDQLEDDGIVAPSGEPGKPREVLYVPPNDG